ncbi:MAG: outer membrane beta-barrel protein [Planctomycetota bacterium]
MRISPFALLAALPLVGAVPRAANDDDGRWYVQFGAGFASPANSTGPIQEIVFDDGFALHGLVGYRLSDPAPETRWGWSAELEGYLSDADIRADGFAEVGASTSEDLTMTAVLLNGIFDWRWSDRVTLYGGGGVGYAPRIDYQSFGNLDHEFGLVDSDAAAWQGKIGLRYRLGASASWVVGYRYLQTEDLAMEDEEIGSSFDLENRQHVLEFGMRWGE